MYNSCDTYLPTRYWQTNVILEPGRAFFPYTKFWRGNYISDTPIVVNRQAGFRPREDEIDIKNHPLLTEHCYPQHCFDTSPLTRFPYQPECTEEVTSYRRNLLPTYRKHFLYR